jgi:hypothetical protein
VWEEAWWLLVPFVVQGVRTVPKEGVGGTDDDEGRVERVEDDDELECA